MRTAITVSILLSAFAASVRAQEKPAITAADYGKWESLGLRANLSPDGRWLAYPVARVNEKNELRVRDMRGDATVAVPFATAAAFSGDSRFLAYLVGVSAEEQERLSREQKPVHNRMVIRDLNSGDTTAVERVASFSFSPDGRHIAMRGYPGEGADGADLLVRDLAAGATTTFGNVTAFAWSDAAPLLAFAVATESGSGNGVHTFDARSGTIRVLDSSTSMYRGLTWRDEAADLAVLRTQPDSAYRDTSHVVLAWRGLDGRAPTHQVLDPADAPDISADLRIANERTPRWSRDGSQLYLGLRPREASPERAEEPAPDTAAADTTVADSAQAPAAPEKLSDVQVWHANDWRSMPMQRAQERADLNRTMLAVWHLDDNAFVQIGSDLMANAVMLEGGRHAVERDREPYRWDGVWGRPWDDIWLIDTRTGERTKVLEKVRYFFGGSSTGRYLLWFEGRDWWTYDITTGTRANVTNAGDDRFLNTEYDYPVEQKPSRSTGGWTKDDDAILIYDRYDVWSFAPEGSGGRRLTDGAADSVIHRVVRLDTDEPGIDMSEPLYLSLTGEWSKKSGIARMRRGRAPERLVFEDRGVSGLARADSAEVYLFMKQAFDDSPDWFRAGPDLANAVQVTETNPFQEDYAWGRAELVEFTSATGRPSQGILLYPANHDPSQRYPMIVYTYEILSRGLHRYIVPSERSYYNYAAWTANGYFVLLPDIVYRPRDPGRSAVEAVEPAVQSIVDRGLVDPDRIGLIGHSWGGYQAAYIPTQTDIFAAAVSGAPLTNFLSFPGAVHWRPGLPEFEHWETGQARMDVPPWEDFDAHVRNSPIAFVQDLETPMLMVFGDDDGTVDFHQGVEFYNYARRARKTDFVMLVYPGEDHGLRQKQNQIDYHRRILQWFGHWLKGEEAPKWMTEGVSWLERKKMLGGGGR